MTGPVKKGHVGTKFSSYIKQHIEDNLCRYNYRVDNLTDRRRWWLVS